MKFRMTMTLCVAAVLFVATSVAQATILTFDIRTDNGTPPGGTSVSNGSLESGTFSTYGSNASATSVDAGSHFFNYEEGNGFTPNIGVSYAKGPAGQTFNISIQSGWGNQPIAYPIANNGQQGTAGDQWFINFSPEITETRVKLNEFTLMDFDGTRDHAADWFVYKDSVSPANIIAAGSTGTFSSSFAAPFVVGTGGVQYEGDMILEIKFDRALRGQMGIDNVNFDQIAIPPVPEPSTLTLAGLAALGLCRMRRRRR